MKDMTGYFGKKVDVQCGDKIFSGYIFDAYEAEDSDIGKDCIDINLIDKMAIVEIAIEDIDKITIDPKYKEFPV